MVIKKVQRGTDSSRLCKNGGQCLGSSPLLLCSTEPLTQVSPTGSNKHVWDPKADSTCTLLVSTSEGMKSKREKEDELF